MIPSQPKTHFRLYPQSQEAIDKDPNRYGKQAYTLSHDRQFWVYAKASNIQEASQFIAKECGVQSLRFIDDTPDAIEKWQALKAQFEVSTPTGE